MAQKLDNLSIRGFKSIESLIDFPLGDLNVLIGANGSGKSNFVEFFRVLRAIGGMPPATGPDLDFFRVLRYTFDQRLDAYMQTYGPADGFFFNGVSYTKRIGAKLMFGSHGYGFTLEPTADGRIAFGGPEIYFPTPDKPPYFPRPHSEYEFVIGAASAIRVYHFHDTSMTAGMRRASGVEQGEALASDASNLAAFLFNLQQRHPAEYKLVCQTLRRIAPYFDDFKLRVTSGYQEDQVRLTWRRKGTDYVFSPGHLSDGTIRFLCMTAALLQPNPPSTIVLDEPELGLHPEALMVLGGLLRSASARMQVIVATQSPAFLSEFDPEHVIAVDQVNGASTFSRLDPAALAEWLTDYSLGELWQKGTIKGGINHA